MPPRKWVVVCVVPMVSIIGAYKVMSTLYAHELLNVERCRMKDTDSDAIEWLAIAMLSTAALVGGVIGLGVGWLVFA